MLFATYLVTASKTKALQKNIITLLRKIDFEDNELLENSRANIMNENSKRNEMIQILNEYGIYFMNYGLTDNEIVRFKTIPYSSPSHLDTRCVICINDFLVGERVRVYPGCNHVFHLKCSQLWLEIEGTCPVCKNTPKDLPPPPDNMYQSLNPLNDRVVSEENIFRGVSSQALGNAPQMMRIPQPSQGVQSLNINQFDRVNLREPLLRG